MAIETEMDASDELLSMEITSSTELANKRQSSSSLFSSSNLRNYLIAAIIGGLMILYLTMKPSPPNVVTINSSVNTYSKQATLFDWNNTISNNNKITDNDHFHYSGVRCKDVDPKFAGLTYVPGRRRSCLWENLYMVRGDIVAYLPTSSADAEAAGLNWTIYDPSSGDAAVGPPIAGNYWKPAIGDWNAHHTVWFGNVIYYTAWLPRIERIPYSTLSTLHQHEGLYTSSGLHLMVGGIWNHNIAHGFYDGFLVSYWAAIYWGFAETPFKVIMHPSNNCPRGSVGGSGAAGEGGDNYCVADELMEKFSGNKLIRKDPELSYLQDTSLFPSKTIIKFEQLLVGNADSGERHATDTDRQWGADRDRGFDLTRKFRDRLHKAYGLPPPMPRKIVHGMADSDYPSIAPSNTKEKHIRAIIVDNKRYTSFEKKMLMDMDTQSAPPGKNRFHNNYKGGAVPPTGSPSPRKYLINDITIYLHIEYVDYGKLSFVHQLEMLNESDMYICGPGTGIFRAELMGDDSVIIHLGAFYVFKGRPQDNNREKMTTTYNGERLFGTNQFSLFYPLPIRRGLLQQNIIDNLINDGIKLTLFDKPPKSLNDNHYRSSIHSRIFQEFCLKYPVDCQKILHNIDGVYLTDAPLLNGEKYTPMGHCNTQLMDNVVQEVSVFAEEPTLDDDGKTLRPSCNPNIGGLREIKKKWIEKGLYKETFFKDELPAIIKQQYPNQTLEFDGPLLYHP